MKIVIILSYDFMASEKNLADVRAVAPDAELAVTNQDEVTPEMVKDAEILFGLPKRPILDAAVNLKWLQLPTAGADMWGKRSLYREPLPIVTNIFGVFGIPIAEHVFCMILAHNKNLFLHMQNKVIRGWSRVRNVGDIYGATFGVLGLGDIGAEVAKRAHAWGARVLAVKRMPGEKPEFVDALYGEDGIDEVLSLSDYVVLALPDTPKTKGIIGEERLKKMKPTSFFVNIARGDLIDQDALVKALREKWIAGAGLDATSPEPLPNDSPLWDMDNVIITPHSSGFSPTNMDGRFMIFNENLRRYLAGEELIELVNMDEGY